jgi:prophage regulatory protein
MGIRLLSYDELKLEKGIGYSKVQLWRLEKSDRFPKRVPLGPSRHGWAEHEIDAWIADRIAARDSSANAPQAAA